MCGSRQHSSDRASDTQCRRLLVPRKTDAKREFLQKLPFTRDGFNYHMFFQLTVKGKKMEFL